MLETADWLQTTKQLVLCDTLGQVVGVAESAVTKLRKIEVTKDNIQ